LTARLLPSAVDYGNAETTNDDNGAGTMECVFFGSWNAKQNGGWCGGVGDGTGSGGPWVMADLEEQVVRAPRPAPRALHDTPTPRPPLTTVHHAIYNPPRPALHARSGLWACGTPNSVNPNTTAQRSDFVVGMVKGDSTDRWGVKAGDAQTGPLVKTYEGARPPGYFPMKKEGAIILGASTSTQTARPPARHISNL
jgi:hypothetical protein